MPQPRKPTAILELNGQMHHNKKRHAGRLHEPKPERPLGDPDPLVVADDSDPAIVREMYEEAWRQIHDAVPEGVLMCSDRWAVEIACTLMVEFRCRVIDRAGLSILSNLLGRFGMTPSDRSKIIAPQKDKKENRFAKLAQVKPIA